MTPYTVLIHFLRQGIMVRVLLRYFYNVESRTNNTFINRGI